jgi:hypothetical protein
MTVYALSGEPRLAIRFLLRKQTPFLESRIMSRRNVAYAILLVASVVVTACSQPTAPSREDTSCRTAISGSSGNRCDP